MRFASSVRFCLIPRLIHVKIEAAILAHGLSRKHISEGYNLIAGGAAVYIGHIETDVDFRRRVPGIIPQKGRAADSGARAKNVFHLGDCKRKQGVVINALQIDFRASAGLFAGAEVELRLFGFIGRLLPQPRVRYTRAGRSRGIAGCDFKECTLKIGKCQSDAFLSYKAGVI